MGDIHAINLRLNDGMHFTADTGDRIELNFDADEAVGGLGRGVRPQKTLLVSLGACMGMDVISILRKKRQDVTAFSVNVQGTKASEHPKVYTKIEITFTVEGPAIDIQAVDRAIELSFDRYCPVANMLKHVVPITTKVVIVEAP